jgi:hypothetical protein
MLLSEKSRMPFGYLNPADFDRAVLCFVLLWNYILFACLFPGIRAFLSKGRKGFTIEDAMRLLEFSEDYLTNCGFEHLTGNLRCVYINAQRWLVLLGCAAPLIKTGLKPSGVTDEQIGLCFQKLNVHFRSLRSAKMDPESLLPTMEEFHLLLADNGLVLRQTPLVQAPFPEIGYTQARAIVASLTPLLSSAGESASSSPPSQRRKPALVQNTPLGLAKLTAAVSTGSSEALRNPVMPLSISRGNYGSEEQVVTSTMLYDEIELAVYDLTADTPKITPCDSNASRQYCNFDPDYPAEPIDEESLTTASGTRPPVTARPSVAAAVAARVPAATTGRSPVGAVARKRQFSSDTPLEHAKTVENSTFLKANPKPTSNFMAPATYPKNPTDNDLDAIDSDESEPEKIIAVSEPPAKKHLAAKGLPTSASNAALLTSAASAASATKSITFKPLRILK